MLGPSRLLTLTRKSKFSKRTCPTRFFEYIPILGPVSSFEVQKLCKRPISKKVDFCPNVDQKVKIFKTDLSHSIFRVHSDFGTRFFIQSSEIVRTSNFQKSWLLCKCWPNVKIFEMDLSCSIFRVHSDFGVRSIIWDLKIEKMTQFQVFKT